MSCGWLQILPLAEVFFSAPVGAVSNKQGRNKTEALTSAQYRTQVTELFKRTVTAASAMLGDGGTLSAIAVAAVHH